MPAGGNGDSERFMTNPFVSSEKVRQLKERLEQLGIRDADIQERFVHARGRGGQKVNKTSACVYLKHLPTGIEVKCQESRSREANRFFARRLLADKVEETISGRESARSLKAGKIRKQKDRRSRRSKQRSEAHEHGPDE
jgi:protein subunit release factor B